MRRIIVTLIIASLLSLTSAAPVFAGGWGGGYYERSNRYYGRGHGFNPLWPITAALSIPAAIIGTVANLAATVPPAYGYAEPQAPETYYAPGACYMLRTYPRPMAYYSPKVYVAPMGYYAPRAYTVPPGYFAPRGHYPVR